MPEVDQISALQFTEAFREEIVERFGLTEPFVQQVFGRKGQKARVIGRWEDLANPAQKMSSAYVHFALSTVVRGRAARDLIARETGITQGTSLDVGSAYGGMVAAFAEGGFDAQGVEIDPHWCALGNLNCRSKGFGDLVKLGDFLGGEDFGTYDVVTCNDVIEHVEQPRRAIGKMAQMLNPGGVLYLVIPNGRSWDHVVRDGHYGQFAMNLLDHDGAKAYYDAACKSAFGKPYSCGEFYDLGWYLDVLADQDLIVGVRRAKKRLPTRTEFDEILAKLDAAHAAWSSSKLTEILADNVHNAFARYRRAIVADYNAAAQDARNVQAFIDTYIEPFWTVISRRRGPGVNEAAPPVASPPLVVANVAASSAVQVPLTPYRRLRRFVGRILRRLGLLD